MNKLTKRIKELDTKFAEKEEEWKSNPPKPVTAEDQGTTQGMKGKE